MTSYPVKWPRGIVLWIGLQDVCPTHKITDCRSGLTLSLTVIHTHTHAYIHIALVKTLLIIASQCVVSLHKGTFEVIGWAGFGVLKLQQGIKNLFRYWQIKWMHKLARLISEKKFSIFLHESYNWQCRGDFKEHLDHRVRKLWDIQLHINWHSLRQCNLSVQWINNMTNPKINRN